MQTAELEEDKQVPVRAKAERPGCVNQCEGRVHSQFRV